MVRTFKLMNVYAQIVYSLLQIIFYFLIDSNCSFVIDVQSYAGSSERNWEIKKTKIVFMHKSLSIKFLLKCMHGDTLCLNEILVNFNLRGRTQNQCLWKKIPGSKTNTMGDSVAKVIHVFRPFLIQLGRNVH